MLVAESWNRHVLQRSFLPRDVQRIECSRLETQ